MTRQSIIPAGRVGVPRDGEMICPSCNGAGRQEGDGPMGGCDRCAGTGVVASTDLRIGDTVPLPPRKLTVNPNANNEPPAPGVFRSGGNRR